MVTWYMTHFIVLPKILLINIFVRWSVKIMLLKNPAAAKSLQSCPTLCNPIDGSPLGSPVPGILQARTLEWVAISFSSAWKWKVNGKSLSCVRLLATPWTAVYQAPLPMEFSRQEYWSGVPLPSLPPSIEGINFNSEHGLDGVKLESSRGKFASIPRSLRPIFLTFWGCWLFTAINVEQVKCYSFALECIPFG